MHEVVKVERKTLEDLELIKEAYNVLKEDIEKLYHDLNSLEIIREHELLDDIEEI